MAKETYEKHYSSYNLGISILKMIMCFMVIVSHIWGVNVVHDGPLGWVYYLREYAVPVFMILTFFFSEKMLDQLDAKKIGKRIVKLIVPLWGWAVIYWIFYKLLEEFLYPGYDLKVKDLFWQMFTGNSIYLNGTMWFQVDLIVLTLLFALIIFVAQRFKNVVFAILSFACVLLSYLGTLLVLFKLKSELVGCVGRFFEVLPMAVIGFMLAYYGILDKSRKPWIATMVLGIVFLRFLRYYKPFSPVPVQTFDYAGFDKLAVALALIFVFNAPPLEKLPKAVHKIVEWVTKYTLGIYCMHRLVSNLLHYFISHRTWDIETFTFIDCVVTYVLCYIISFLISLIPCKWTKMMVE